MADALGALALLRARQAFTERILLASLEVSGVLAEIECEAERGNQLRDRLLRADEALIHQDLELLLRELMARPVR